MTWNGNFEQVFHSRFLFRLRFHFFIRGSCHLIIPVQNTIPNTAVATKLVTPG